MAPKTSPTWILPCQNGIESLQLLEETPVPEIGDDQVLVKVHAASLNYRDIVIAKVCDIIIQTTCQTPKSLFRVSETNC